MCKATNCNKPEDKDGFCSDECRVQCNGFRCTNRAEYGKTKCAGCHKKRRRRRRQPDKIVLPEDGMCVMCGKLTFGMNNEPHCHDCEEKLRTSQLHEARDHEAEMQLRQTEKRQQSSSSSSCDTIGCINPYSQCRNGRYICNFCYDVQADNISVNKSYVVEICDVCERELMPEEGCPEGGAGYFCEGCTDNRKESQ